MSIIIFLLHSIMNCAYRKLGLNLPTCLKSVIALQLAKVECWFFPASFTVDFLMQQ